MRSTRVWVIVILTGCLIVMASGSPRAQEAGFSLATWQSVTLDNYTLRYTGLSAGWPSYHLYYLGSFVAAFPPNPLPATCCEYSYGNVSIVTTGVAPDGSAVTGAMTVR